MSPFSPLSRLARLLNERKNMPRVTKQSGGGKPARSKPKTPKKSGVLDRISPIERPEAGVKLSLYGRSGTGKTTFACSFPKPLLLIRPADYEDGRLSVYDIKGVDDIPIYEPAELLELAEWLRDGDGKSKYKSVVLDTASALQNMLLKSIMGLDELPPQLSFGFTSRENWMNTASEMKEHLRRLLTLTQNVVIVAQERSFGDPEEEGSSSRLEPSVSSAVMPSVAGYLNPAADYVVQTYLQEVPLKKKKKLPSGKVVERSAGKEVRYCLRTAPDPIYTVKLRRPKGARDTTPLPEYLVDPDYEKFAELIGLNG